jgi:hypothetical protein
MRKLLWLAVWVGLAAGSLSAGQIGFQVTPLGGNSFEYDYFLSGFTFQANQELDIRFDPSLYGALVTSSGVAPSGYQVTLLQPSNPLGTFGDYSAYALIDNPSTAGPFSVRFTFTGGGQPGPQPFFVNQYDQNGFLSSTIASGLTVPEPSGTGSEVPEPASLTLTGAALLLGGLWSVGRRRQGPKRPPLTN